MTRISCVRPLACAALLLLPGALRAAQPEPLTQTPQPMRFDTVRYSIRYMDLHAAEVLAWNQCEKKERCRVVALAVGGDATLKGYLEVTGDPPVQEAIARALAKEDSIPLTQSFQVLLLAAGPGGGNSGLEVPANAQKALNDLKGFLPFRSYELLDAVWVRGTQDRLMDGRLVGRGGSAYAMRLRFRNVGSPEERNLFFDTFHIREEPYTPRPSAAGGNEGQPVAPRPPRELISTTFGVKMGETIVVGTSKVDGTQEALVVLLTAVPSP
jgi:hypothetical protein